MASVLKLFWNICVLRRGPELVPSHTWFVATLIAVDVVCSVLVTHSFSAETNVFKTVGYLVIVITTTAALTWFALFVRNLTARFQAVLAALVGCDILLTAMLGALLVLNALMQAPAAALFTGIFHVWAIVVWGFIYKRAFDSNLTLGVLIAFGVMFISFLIGQVAIGPAG